MSWVPPQIQVIPFVWYNSVCDPKELSVSLIEHMLHQGYNIYVYIHIYYVYNIYIYISYIYTIYTNISNAYISSASTIRSMRVSGTSSVETMGQSQNIFPENHAATRSSAIVAPVMTKLL